MGAFRQLPFLLRQDRTLPRELTKLRDRLFVSSTLVLAAILIAVLVIVWLFMAWNLRMQEDAALQQALEQPAPTSPSGDAAQSDVAVAGAFPIVRLAHDGSSARDESGILSNADASKLMAAITADATSGDVHALGRIWCFERYGFGSVSGGAGKPTFSADEAVSGEMIFLIDVTADRESLTTLACALFAVGACGVALIAVTVRLAVSRALAPAAGAWERQERFVFDASHELKTPLASMSSTLDVVLASPGKTVGEQERWTSYLRQDIDEMSGLVRALLESARELGAEPGAMDAEPGASGSCDVGETIRSLLGRSKERADARGITLATEVPQGISVACPAEAVSPIVGELLENALKYTEDGGRIRISACRKGRRVRVVVENTGPGIRPEDLSHVFDRLWRGDSARTDGARSGYGLGLAIARDRAERLGGTIHAASKPGRLTTFTFELPTR